jgi:SAM-dependent methyltransferase
VQAGTGSCIGLPISDPLPLRTVHEWKDSNLKSQLKQRLKHTLRHTGLLELAERIRTLWVEARAGRDNRSFCKEHPDFVVPPLALLVDITGHASFRKYWACSNTVRSVVDLIEKHHPNPERVLEWGCGPARILRHLPEFLPQGTQLFGTDYNRESIRWCKEAIPGITFAENGSFPPLPFAENYFDVIYALSVLTHLSVSQQDAWMKELRRVLRPGGHIILTTHGEYSGTLLTATELLRFQDEGFVVRDRVQEGSRSFAAYHHPDYARNHLFAGFQVREHIPGSSAANTWQDTWVLQ